ncbi:MAG: flagellar hook protein FlgE [Planctomycetota bacterium]|jgi:flagellar hook protein FlgE
MFTALRIGLTGLRVNQRYLDVIGNNLTNAETAGFKADRLTFSDVLYSTSRAPTGPSANLGGVNGRQFGFGTQVASVDQSQTQGALLNTGRTFDLALQGSGFFVLSNGTEDFYSRVGSLTLDRNSNLVDSRTGFRVKNASGSSIRIDTESVAPAVASQNVTFAGNLPALKTGPLAEMQETSAAFDEVQPAVLTGAATGSGDGSGELLTLNLDSSQIVQIPLSAGATSLTNVAAEINSYFSANPTTPNVTADASTGVLVLTSSTDGAGSKIAATGTGTLLADIGLNTNPTAVGQEFTATSATSLSNLDSNTADYANGDVIQITGINAAGNSVNSTFSFGPTGSGFDGETLGDLTAKIQTEFPGTTVALTPDGKITVESGVTGASDLTISLQDLNSNSGSTLFSAQAFGTAQAGTGPDIRSTSITVFDSLGISHTLSGQFERQDDDTWNLELSVPDDEGTLTGSPVTQISFGPNGAFQGSGLPQIDLVWNNTSSVQSVNLDFGTVGDLTGLTQFGTQSSAQATTQDGYESGTLASMGVTSSGSIQGFYSNGAIIDLDSIGIAQFQNSAGLIREGSTLFRRSDNSGQALVGQAGVGGAGGLVSGALEGSNVDTAEEFVRLIEAQRSFQGAARIVTTADEIFAELLQIV